MKTAEILERVAEIGCVNPDWLRQNLALALGLPVYSAPEEIDAKLQGRPQIPTNPDPLPVSYRVPRGYISIGQVGLPEEPSE